MSILPIGAQQLRRNLRKDLFSFDFVRNFKITVGATLCFVFGMGTIYSVNMSVEQGITLPGMFFLAIAIVLCKELFMTVQSITETFALLGKKKEEP